MPMLVLAAVAFVGTHFLLSHPFRAPIVRATGEGAFLAIYSLVAAATLAWLAFAYRAAPASPSFWPVGDALWAVATVLMLVASVLLAGSLVGNPALPNAKASGAAPARGVFAVTRHPMMWSFAIWGVAHILVYPAGNTIVVAVAIIVLALVGAMFQDRKKERLQPDAWPAWERRTSFVPFAAIAAGRARPSWPGAVALVGGLLFWLAATWAHLPLAGWPAGIWRWL